MPETQQDFFYDEQIRRYLLQFVRIFTAFQYETGSNANGEKELRQVPARYAQRDRMVSHILRNNSENVLLSTPFITCWIQNLEKDDNRRQNPTHVSTVNTTERKIENGKYTSEDGNRYTVQRYMPVPYNLKLQVDIWTTNEKQKHQILEQILILFNPSIDIQSSTNPVDWTSLTVVTLDDITWSSRSIPIGSDDDIDMSTITFEVPIWINPPAKVQKQNIIRKIHQNVFSVNEIFDTKSRDIQIQSQGTLIEIVLRGWTIFVENDKITLLTENGNEYDENGELCDWENVFEKYGSIIPGVSELRLVQNSIDNDNDDITGLIQKTSKQNELSWMTDPQTLPSNTLDNIDAIIDPHRVYPGKNLPDAITGQRYLIINDIGDVTEAWGEITAHENDIIQYDGIKWVVVFDSKNVDTKEFVVNNNTKEQLEWDKKEWIFSIKGLYKEGEFRIYLCP